MTSMPEKLALATIPQSPSLEEVTFEHLEGDAVLRFNLERGGEVYRTGLRFDTVRAYRFRTEGHCTAWHVTDVYDALAEVRNSEWVRELLSAEAAATAGHWRIRHFIIYIEDVGCFEVGAASWSWLEEERLR